MRIHQFHECAITNVNTIRKRQQQRTCIFLERKTLVLIF